MKDTSRLKPEDFETLLKWFSPDREQAGAEYLKLREGLIRFFRYKGCSDVQTLADETINRVAEKIPELDDTKRVTKLTIFYGFASNIFLEYLRNQKRESEKLNKFAATQSSFTEIDEEYDDSKIECLNECLGKLSAEEREIFLEYYGQENEKKSLARKKIAARLHCEMNTLHVRVFRLRGVLAKCIEKCMKKSL